MTATCNPFSHETAIGEKPRDQVLPLNGRPKRPAYNLAIPAVLFGPVRRTVGTAGEVGLHARRSVDYRKAAGRDIAPAQEIERILLGTSDEDRIFRIDPYL
jgi:glucose-6-phosphate 1-dehydrogenase